MRLPTWDELIDEQRDVLEVPLDKPLFVAGPPGSGKTTLAIRRADMIKNAGQDVLVITYNRMLRRTIRLLAGTANAHTMQTYVCRDYYRRTTQNAPMLAHDPYALNWPLILRQISPGAHNHNHAVVDEGQDLPEDFFRYAVHHIAPALSVFADENQAISAARTTLKQIKNAANLPSPILLTVNHRNTPEIARVATFFHSGALPAAEVQRTSSGEVPRLIKSTGIGATCSLILNMYQTRGGSVGVVVKSNSVAATACSELKRLLPNHRVNLYTSDLKNEDSINVLKDGITILNVESVKGQEFDALFLLELEAFIPCNDDQQRRVLYMVCARARDQLFLVYGPKALSSSARAGLPPETLLERT